MRKTLGLAAVATLVAGVFLPASSASAADHCQIVFTVGGRYHELDEKAHDLLPDLVWYCTE